MLEIAGPITRALEGGSSVALATVTAVEGSAPLPIGSTMMVDSYGAVTGSVSGGCVESDVYERAQALTEIGGFDYGVYGIDDDTAAGVGLSCGGDLSVAVQRIGPDSPLVEQLGAAARGEAAAIGVVVVGPATMLGTTVTRGHSPADLARVLMVGGVPPTVTSRAAAEILARLTDGPTGMLDVDCEGELLSVFCEVRERPPLMVIIGAVDFAVALSAGAQLLGHSVLVCDPRAIFVTEQRFPGAQLSTEWPSDALRNQVLTERDSVCLLSHDDRYDADVLVSALKSPAGFVGALGSRRTHEKRLGRIGDRLGPAELGRLHSPIGLDLGASTPAETAVAILAEIIATRRGGGGTALRDGRGPIHHSG